MTTNLARDFNDKENVINNYNAAFFGLFENVFKLLKEEYGEARSLEHFSSLMERGLSKSYGSDFQKSDPNEFKRLVSERDRLVGLRVEFPEILPDRLVYQFYDDPFPGLKGHVEPNKLDRCYMHFKVQYILGPEWDYKTTKHLWNGDICTEHLIYKN